MPTYPRYLTYRPEQLEARLRELDKAGQFPVTSLTAVNGAANSVGSGALPGRSRLVKSHSCPVAFPDGQEGTCAYTRGGPAWHQFRFTHGTGNAATLLPVLHMTERVSNDRASIEEAAKRLASVAYTAAIRRERTDYFQRASEGGGRKRRPERCQMKTERARQLAGKYALCRALGTTAGGKLLPVSTTFESLDAVNEAWREKGDRNLVVACCNRLDRCWEMPRYNPLYAAFDPRPRLRPCLRTPEGTAAALTGSLTARATAPAASSTAASSTAASSTAQDTAQSHASVTAQDEDWAYLPGPDDSEDDTGDDTEDEDLNDWDQSDLDESDEEDEQP